MPTCKKCQTPFKNRITIDGVCKNVGKRVYCLECSPYKRHNTRPIEIPLIVLNQKTGETSEVIRVGYGEESTCACCHRVYVRTKSNKCIGKCNSCRVNIRRFALKMRLVDYKGGKCEKCGYNSHYEVLQFHHRDPTQKEVSDSGAEG